MVKLLADCSYGFESIDVISGLYSIGDTVAVTARYLDSMLWGDATAHYPVLMVIPFENGSLANTRFLNPETGIDKSVLSFYSHIEELQSEFREIEEKARLSRTEPGRVTGIITVEDYDERLQQNRRSLGAIRMRMNFELQRNLAKIHNSEVHDERIHYLTMLGHDWYAGWGRDSKVTRKKFDCGYTSLITHYFSYSSMTYELFHRFKENNGRSLPALDDCISEFNLPFTR